MGRLEKIQKRSEKFIREAGWTQEETDRLVKQVNEIFTVKAGQANENDNSLVVHPATYSGGFIVFGGWTKIYDKTVPSGTRGHELYLAFGGVGAGGWSGECDIEIMTEGTIEHDGKTYARPIHYYTDRGSDWDNCRSGYEWFYNHVKSFMFMYLPQFIQPIPVFVYFDGSSNKIGISVPNVSLSTGLGGGSVKVKK